MKRFILIIVSLFVVSLGLFAFLLGSQPGLQVITSLVSYFSGGIVSVNTSRGRALGSFRLEGIKLVTPATDISIAKLDGDWRPTELLRGNLHIGKISVKDIVVEMKSNGKDNQTPVNTILLPELSAPLPLLVDSITLENVVIQKIGGAEVLRIERFFTSLSGKGNELSLDELMLSTPDYGISLQGALQMSADWPLDIAGSWWVDPPECFKMKGDIAVAGSIGRVEISASLLQPQQLQVRGSLLGVLDHPSWKLKGQGVDVRLAEICDMLPPATINLDIETSGNTNNYKGNIKSKFSFPDNSPIQGVIAFSGNERGIVLDSAQIESKGNEAEVSGTVSWKDTLFWNASLSLDSFDLSVYENLPSVLLGGELLFEGQASEQGLHYQVNSSKVEGHLAEPPMSVSGGFHLSGDTKQLELSQSQFALGDGSVTISGSLNWSDGLSWDTRIQLKTVDPSVFPFLPTGRVNADVSSSGSFSGDDISLDAIISSMSGTLAGYDLEGTGELGYRDKRITARGLRIKNGDNLVTIDGVVDDRFGLDFKLVAPELHRFYPELKGDLRLSGHLGGAQEHPVLTVKGRGSNLSYQAYRLDSLLLDGTVGLMEKEEVRVSLELKDLEVQGFLVQQASAEITGARKNHDILVEAHTEKETLRFKGSGTLNENNSYEGHVGGGIYEHIVYGNWRQRGQADFTASAAGAALNSLCLFSDQNDFCGSGSWEASGNWNVDVPHAQFHLADLNSYHLFDTPIRGEVSAGIKAQGRDSIIQSGSGTLTIPEMSMDLDAGDLSQDFRWYDTALSFNLAESRLQAGLKSRFVDGSTVNFDLQVKQFGDLSREFNTLPLEGQLQLDLKDLSPLKLLSGDYLVPSGHLVADLMVSGILNSPSISGDVSLREGELRFPELGIALTELSGELRGEGRTIQVNLDAVAGEGKVKGSGELDFTGQDWRGLFTITGTNGELMKQSDLNIIVDPDVQLELGPAGGKLTGRIDIPRALLAPEEMTNSDSASADVIFVDEQGDNSSWPFEYDLTVVLGDEVRVEGYGVSGNLVGNLDVKHAAGGNITGRGALETDGGTFTIYDRSLNISRGRILFNGGAIGNPGLDISARKSVGEERSGRPAIVVGIDVTGTVHDHRVELFSSPHMEDSEVLAYILLDKSLVSSDESSKSIVGSALKNIGLGTGNEILGGMTGLLPVDQVHFESGISDDDPSVVLGKNLTEDLSVGYDFNLFKNKGFFTVRYHFGRGFSIESRNSVDSNGLELFYSFER